MTEHTLIFVIKGIKLLHFSGETLEVKPDSIFLLKKGIYVMAEYIEEGLSFEAPMLFLPQRMLQEFLRKRPVFPEAAGGKSDCLVMKATDQLQTLKFQLREYFEHPSFDYPSLIPLKQQEAFVLIQATEQGKAAISFLRSASRDDLEELAMVVGNYLLQPVTLAELAALSNRSLATFKRDFQKLYQNSPRSWINQKRLEHARLLLENTNKTVGEICTECGFDSVSHFIRLYKTQYDCTPGAVRAKIAIA